MGEIQTQNKNAIQLFCPHCGRTNVSIRVFREDVGNDAVSKMTSEYEQEGDGLFLRIRSFPIRLIQKLSKKEESEAVLQSADGIRYKTICLCGNCGHSWVNNELTSNNEDSAKKDIG